MAIQERKVGDTVVLAPIGRMVLGGPAEEYEERVQLLLSSGVQHIVTDFSQISHIDSTGIRSIIRGYTTAHRTGAVFGVASMSPIVRMVMQVTRLDTVIPMYPTVDAALGEAS